MFVTHNLVKTRSGLAEEQAHQKAIVLGEVAVDWQAWNLMCTYHCAKCAKPHRQAMVETSAQSCSGIVSVCSSSGGCPFICVDSCTPWLFLELLTAHLFFTGILGVWHLVNLGFSLREEIFTSNHITLTDTVLVYYFLNGVAENFSIHTGCGFVGIKLFITLPIISTIYKLCSDVDLYYLYRICSNIASWIPDSGSLCPHWSC